MDMRTGEIFDNPSEEQIKKKNLQPLTQEQADLLKGITPEERAFEFELSIYMAGRKHIKGLLAASIRQAFRAGFDAKGRVENK